MSPDDSRFSSRVFQLVALALLGYLLFRIFLPFLGPLLWALLVALILFPVNRRLRRALKGRQALAAAILTGAVTLGIALPVALLGIAFARQAVELAQRLGDTAEHYRIAGVQDLVRLPVLGSAVAWLQTHLDMDAARVQAWLVQAAEEAVRFLLARGRGFLFTAFGVFGDLTLLLFVLFFFLRDGDAMARRAVRLLPVEAGRRERLAAHLSEVTEAVVLGTVITAMVQGTLIGVAFWITGLPSPVVFGVLAAIASFVPLVGTALVVAPAAIVLAATEGIWWKAVFMVGWGVVVSGSADNLLKPLLISGKAEIGTLPVFIGVIGGLASFGMVGLFLGPVIIALALALLDFADEARAAGELRAG